MYRSLPRILMAAATLATLACGEERAPIDRTQPNKIDKALLQGEWYYQQTVVDIPGTWSFTFIGESNFMGMDRVRWDIQEQWLYGRRSFERIKDAEGVAADTTVSADGKPYLGAIIVAYPITSHFDIKRAYNTTTGEATNVIEENTTDQPWYDRQYMRVDWSKNYATSFGFMVDDVEQNPIEYYIQDQNDPDAPVFDAGEFDAAGNMVRQPYMDVTNTVMVKPGMTYFEEIGESYPTCFLFSRATADCTTEIIKVRNSFLRLDPARQYVPEPFKGAVTDYFGLFTQDRLVYSDQQEVSEKNRERVANLHNLWQQWYTDAGDVIEPGQRTLRPMVYYAHNWPKELDDTLRGVEQEWNAVFQRAVAGAKGVGSVSDAVFIVCHAPVDAARGDNVDACIPDAYKADPSKFNPRIGDVRYNWVAYNPKYYDGFKLLGFGPSNTDPITGEILSAGAYLYTYNDTASQTTAEQIQLLNGDLNPFTYIDGLDLTDWQQAQASNADAQRIVTQDEKLAMVRAQNYDWVTNLIPATDADRASLAGKSIHQVLKQVSPSLYSAGAFNGEMSDAEGRLGSLKDTYIENMLVNPEIELAAGIMPGSSSNAFSEELLNRASIARMGPVKVMDAIERKKQFYARVYNLDQADTADDSWWGLAQEFKNKSIDEVRAAVRERVYHAVLTHELGHSFNLHHNFGGTEDVVNYQDDYWKIRSNPAAGDGGRVGPRWTDPITDYELKQNIYRYAYTSIMDYSQLTLDYGPGKYDSAAILLGYGGKVETFANIGTMPDPAGGFDIFQAWSENRGDATAFYFTGPVGWHYTKWWDAMRDKLYDMSNRVLVDASTVDWTTGLTKTGQVRVPYIFCSPYTSDIGSNCLTRDYGADEYERMQHTISKANTWYITRSFTRYKVGASPEEYVGRYYDRIYKRMKEFNDLYALYVGLFKSIGYTDAQVETFLTSDLDGWGAYTIAEHDALNFLLQTLAEPTIDYFSPTSDGAGQQYMGVNPFGQGFNTSPTTGRFFSTSWTAAGQECGMYFWECLNHYGFYLDKVMALEALSDAQTYFIARDTPEDIRDWRVSFYDNYSGVLQKYFGDLLTQDYVNFAPRYDQNAVDIGHLYVWPDYAMGTVPTVGVPMDPAASFTVQIYAAVLGMARFQNNFDKTFLDSTRMWLRGSGFAVENSFGVAEYADPISGKVYQAINFPDLDGSKPGVGGIARRMIDRANLIVSRSTYCTVGCVDGLSDADKAKADDELHRYGQLLDVMVDLTGYYETYTQQYGNPYDPGSL